MTHHLFRRAALGATLAATILAPLPAQAFTADPITAVWFPAWAGADGAASMNNNLGAIDEVLFFWYSLNEDGTLGTDAGAHAHHIKAVQDSGGLAYLTVRNGFLPKRFSDMVNDPAKRAQHITDLIAKMEAMNFDGIDVDYEGLYEADRDAFTAFITDLAAEVHARNRMLSVAIQAKTSEPGAYASTRAQAWAPVGAVVDRFRVMTYDKHYSGSGPGPVAPLPWMLDVLRFGATQMDPVKLHVGFPFYGYVWPEGGRGSAVTWSRAQELIAEHNVPVAYHDRDKAPTFSYQREVNGVLTWHHAWYEDARSIQDKVNALRDLPVGGASVWRLGKEDPGNFVALASVRDRPMPPAFSDVPEGSLAAEQIAALHRRGVVSGEDGAFNPSRSVSRAETVKIALGHLRMPPVATDPQASDVPRDSWPAPLVATAKKRQIINGYEDGTFRPWNPITRSEALKIIMRARNIPAGGRATLPPDVPLDAWYADLLRSALDRGIVRGDTDGRFRPEDPISRAELVAILTRT